MAISNFEKTMQEYGYKFYDSDGPKVTFFKETRISVQFLVFDLERKSINPILAPKTLILYERDLTKLMVDFLDMRKDAEKFMEKSKYTYTVLNK